MALVVVWEKAGTETAVWLELLLQGFLVTVEVLTFGLRYLGVTGSLQAGEHDQITLTDT